MEQNEIIAVFMDGVYYDAWENEKYQHPNPHWWFDNAEEKVVFELKYHSSWDALMPACLKWDNLFAEQVEPDEYQYLCDLLDMKAAVYEITPLWEQLVDNIKWYNNTQKQNQ